ncbi:RNA polymerase sigma factor [Amycolatopsis sp. NPDC059657]|uniref:RNA polymerase sigma factor n=1 Tax=Amycolatopsis sp. NPDC059657 TaxID=3346899 RepID=UPI0036704924
MLNRDLGRLVRLASAGDQTAWTALVRSLSVVVRNAAHASTLCDADVRDVCQDAWLALVGKRCSLDHPERLPGWLATAARRCAHRRVMKRRSDVPLACRAELAAASPEQLILLTERDKMLWNAVASLPRRSRALMWLLAHYPELTQQEIATELGIRPGSVGPLRRRCLDRLRHLLVTEGFD